MRVRLVTLGSDDGSGVEERDDLSVRARALDQLVDPLVHLAAGGEDDIRAGDSRGVARARLVVVRVCVRGEDAVNVGTVPGDVARDVRDLRRRRDHLGFRTLVRGAAARQQGKRRNANETHSQHLWTQ